MMPHSITINQALIHFKQLIEEAILSDGASGKEAIIRSSKPIMNIHEAVKAELIRYHVNQERIFPPLGETTPELKLAGFLKKKSQDICVIPDRLQQYQETLTDGLLQGELDLFGKEYTEKTISINIRSQISSLDKNFDTLYERTIAEAYNLHLRCPKMCLGEVYLIAIPEYDSEFVKQKKIGFVTPNTRWLKNISNHFKPLTKESNVIKKSISMKEHAF